MSNAIRRIMRLGNGLLVLILVVTMLPLAGLSASAAPTELFFSEYIEGSSYNKALEIYNGTGSAVDLAAGGYNVQMYFNGSTSAGLTIDLTGTVADGDVYVVAHSSAVAAILAQADQTNGAGWFNGNDAVVLGKGTSIIDIIGQIGVNPDTEWGTDLTSTANNTLRRKETIEAGDTDGSDPFDPAVEWNGYAVDTFDGLGTHSIGGGPEPGQPLPLVENFDDCTLAGWEIVSVDADTAHTWSCNATYSNIDANGYGDSAPANEWLITPPLNLDAQGNDTLTFRSYTNYTDSGVPYPQLQVLYSTDYDGGGDPTGATWTALSGITFSSENSGEWTDSGDVDLSGISGTNVYIAFQYVSSGTGGGSAANWRLDAINIFEQVLVSDWVLNEIHADPASDLSGDANGDGTRDSGQDEFVEIYNNSGADVDVGGWTLSDTVGVRHTFPAGTTVPASCAIVVFGGGTPTGAFGGSVIQTASTGALGLNNGGDSVTLFDGSGNVAAYSYGGEGGDNQSLTRDPDITGPEPLVKHTTATGAGGALFSPGTMVDGTKFAGCVLVNLIHDIQGSGAASPLEGSSVTIEGIVVGDFQNNAEEDNGDLRGFYVQEEDADADADPLTSEGVFVYDGYSPATDVKVGDFVRVKGQVAEYNGITEITSLTEVTVMSSDNDLPTPAAVTLPLSALTDMEAYEGMSVTFPQALYICEYYNFDRYGEIVLTSARQNQPTAVVEPGPDAVALAGENLLDRIILDDGRTSQNPDPAIHPDGSDFDLSNLFRGGDTVENVTGVVDYYNGYKIQPTMGANYVSVNPRTAQPDTVGGNLKVASFNVLNYFTTIDAIQDDSGPNDPADDVCGPLENQECRGADTSDEFTRQRDKIIAALAAIDADVVGLIEIENHPGDVPTADLVSGLNDAMGAGTYDYVATGAIGSDAIRQALIYKPAAVTPLGAYVVLDSSVDARFLDDYNRPVLAQAFQDNVTGGIFTVAVNHLKSKGSDCNAVGDPDTGDGSGNCNLTRKAAAEALVDWLATDPTGSGDGDYLIIGDLNSYDKEDPIDVLLAGGYTDLVGAYGGEYAYSYLFDGQLGYLDYALANAALLDEVAGVTVWHINADEPDLIDYDMTYKQDAQDALYAPDAYRASDHDPVIVGLSVCDETAPTLEVSVSPDRLWPANHKYVTVEATVQVTDNWDPNPTVTLVSVTSNEADEGLGDGDMPFDIVLLDDYSFDLRAERSGTGEGRVYTITYQAVDACGNSTLASVEVAVPHDMGK